MSGAEVHACPLTLLHNADLLPCYSSNIHDIFLSFSSLGTTRIRSSFIQLCFDCAALPGIRLDRVLQQKAADCGAEPLVETPPPDSTGRLSGRISFTRRVLDEEKQLANDETLQVDPVDETAH